MLYLLIQPTDSCWKQENPVKGLLKLPTVLFHPESETPFSILSGSKAGCACSLRKRAHMLCALLPPTSRRACGARMCPSTHVL